MNVLVKVGLKGSKGLIECLVADAGIGRSGLAVTSLTH